MVDLSVLCYPNGTEVDYYSVCLILSSVSEVPDETRDVTVGHRYWTMDRRSSLYDVNCWRCWVHHWIRCYHADLWVDLSVHSLSLQVKATWMVVVYCLIQLGEEDHCNIKKVLWYYEGKTRKRLESLKNNVFCNESSLVRSYFSVILHPKPCVYLMRTCNHA